MVLVPNQNKVVLVLRADYTVDYLRNMTQNLLKKWHGIFGCQAVEI